MQNPEEHEFTEAEHQRKVRNLTILFFIAFLAIGMAYCRFLQTYPTPDLKLEAFERKTFGILPPTADTSHAPDSTAEDSSASGQQQKPPNNQ